MTSGGDDFSSAQARARLSQAQTARFLGCSQTHVRRLAAAGKLHAEPSKPDGHGPVWYDAEEVHALGKGSRGRKRGSKTARKSYSSERGRWAAKVFPYFDRGIACHRRIVIETECDPVLVRELYTEWLLTLDESLRRERAAAKTREAAALQREHDRANRVEDWHRRKLELAREERRTAEALARRSG